MFKSVVSVVCGFLVWSVVWLVVNQLAQRLFSARFNADGTTDDALVLCVILWGSIGTSLLSAWVAAKIARRKPVFHALALGVILLVVGILVQLQYWEVMPLWYHVAFLASLIPACYIGGVLQGRTSA